MPTNCQATPELHLDHQVCFLLYAASRRMTAIYRPLLEGLGLTYPQYLVMLVLWERGTSSVPSLAVGELGDRLQLDSGTLTPLLKRMQQQGLIERHRNPDDERQVRISLTPAGQALRQQAVAVPQRLACLAREAGLDLEGLRASLTRFMDALEPGRASDPASP